MRNKKQKILLLLLILSLICLVVYIFIPIKYNNDVITQLEINSLYQQAFKLYQNGDINECIRVEESAKDLVKKVYGINSNEYLTELYALAQLNHERNNYSEAYKFLSEALSLKKDNYDLDYALLLSNLAMCSSILGEDDKAIELENLAMKIKIETVGENSLIYANSLSNMAEYHYSKGRIIDAIYYEQDAQKIREIHFANNKYDYTVSLSHLSKYYVVIGNLDKAYQLINEAISIRKSINHEYRPLLNELAQIYIYQGNNRDAYEILQKMEIFYQQHPQYIKEYASFLETFASIYFNVGNYTKSICYYNKAMSLLQDTTGVHSKDYILAFLYKYRCLLYLNDTSEIKYNTELLLVINNEFKQDFFIKRETNNLLTLYAYFYNDTNRLTSFVDEEYTLAKKYIKQRLSSLSSSNRQRYWNEERFLYEIGLPNYAYSFPSDTLAQCAYDGILMSKGVLLNTEIELAALIAESGDKVADELYQQLLLNRGQLNKLYEMPISERWADTDSMELATEKIEHELIERSKMYGDFTRDLTIDWKQVQAQLKEDDIAIEFLSFPIENDSVMYCALTLKHDYDAPRMVPLFEARDLAKISETDYFTTLQLTQLVWQPLAEELQSVQNIYFAPAGELHRIAIEYLPFGNEGRYVFDYWKLYRLSSTRELAKTKSEKNSTNVVLYGGLRYEAEGVKFEKDVTWGTNYLAMTRALPDSIGLRAQYGYLHGTLNEVTEINALYEKNNIPTMLYTGSIGTESTIKALSGKRISNLHISTHGFYYSEKEVESKQDLRHLSFLQHDDTPRYIEDKSMTRSGLLFAGANATLKGDSIPEGCDDGILTAQEIASLDFRGLDLLVLSACQTGLGEIKGDGVFGLQRGFKKAGAQTIVMSLWKVDDFATNLLMTQFYNNLLAGHSKREAFHKALDVVRSNYPDNPHKWAGFIMLDGLN